MRKELFGIGMGAVLAAVLASGCSPTVMANRDVIPPATDNPPPSPVVTWDQVSQYQDIEVTDNRTWRPSETIPVRQVPREYSSINMGSIPTGPSGETTSSLPTPSVTGASAGTYKVVAGDTLSQIAQRHGVKTADLASYNNLNLKSIIRVGQVLNLPPGAKADSGKPAAKPAGKPAGNTSAAPVTAAGGTYTVVSGDYAERIARKHGVKTADLLKANNLTEKSVLQIGQKLVIPGKGAATAVQPSGTTATPKPATTTTPGTTTTPANETPAPSLNVEEIPDLPVEDPTLTEPAGTTITQPVIDETTSTTTTTTTTTTQRPLTMVVDRDQNITDFARRYSISEEEIRRHNANYIEADGTLKAGTVILIP